MFFRSLSTTTLQTYYNIILNAKNILKSIIYPDDNF